MNGIIFDIKEFSIYDGPGGRVTVFMKGCPLRCRWCHNPEGLSAAREIVYKENLCTKCGKCMQKCSHAECSGLGRCIHACANSAISIAGTSYGDEELANKLMSYKEFFDISGGGVTFSGGEPLMQGEFVLSAAKRLPGIHKAIETSGYASAEVYRQVIGAMDFVMQDIKIADPLLHKKYTGADNGIILKNIEHLKRSGKELLFRVPLIPGITDTEENLKKIAELVGDYPAELLSYNTMAGAKYQSVGREYELSEKQSVKKDCTVYFKNAVQR